MRDARRSRRPRQEFANHLIDKGLSSSLFPEQLFQAVRCATTRGRSRARRLALTRRRAAQFVPWSLEEPVYLQGGVSLLRWVPQREEILAANGRGDVILLNPSVRWAADALAGGTPASSTGSCRPHPSHTRRAQTGKVNRSFRAHQSTVLGFFVIAHLDLIVTLGSDRSVAFWSKDAMLPRYLCVEGRRHRGSSRGAAPHASRHAVSRPTRCRSVRTGCGASTASSSAFSTAR